jgi:hypothetical protein
MITVVSGVEGIGRDIFKGNLTLRRDAKDTVNDIRTIDLMNTKQEC